MRRLAGNDPEVNEEWIDDKSRFAFRYLTRKGRITRPMVRGSDGVLRRGVLDRGAAGGRRGPARGPGSGGIGVLAGGRLTVEDAYAYAKFARVAAGTNDVDFRARPHCAEELDFLAAHVVGQRPRAAELHRGWRPRPRCCCVALEPEEEAPIVFLRLRKAAQKHRQKVFHLGQWTTPAVLRTAVERGSAEPAARDGLIRAVPGRRGGGARRPGRTSPRTSSRPSPAGASSSSGSGPPRCRACSPPSPGSPSAPAPPSAGCRGGRGSAARSRRAPCPRCCPAVARSPTPPRAPRSSGPGAWPTARCRTTPGRSTGEILDAAAAGELAALVVGGVDPHDLPDPAAALAGAARGRLPGQPGDAHVARSPSWPTSCSRSRPDAQRSGSYVNWEGRRRGFGPALDASGVLPDCRVLDTLAVEMDVDLFTQTPGGRGRRAGPARARTPASPAGPVRRRRASRCGRSLRAGRARDLAAAARRVLARASTSPRWPAPPGPRSCGSTRRRPSAWA